MPAARARAGPPPATQLGLISSPELLMYFAPLAVRAFNDMQVQRATADAATATATATTTAIATATATATAMFYSSPLSYEGQRRAHGRGQQVHDAAASQLASLSRQLQSAAGGVKSRTRQGSHGHASFSSFESSLVQFLKQPQGQKGPSARDWAHMSACVGMLAESGVSLPPQMWDLLQRRVGDSLLSLSPYTSSSITGAGVGAGEEGETIAALLDSVLLRADLLATAQQSGQLRTPRNNNNNNNNSSSSTSNSSGEVPVHEAVAHALRVVEQRGGLSLGGSSGGVWRTMRLVDSDSSGSSASASDGTSDGDGAGGGGGGHMNTKYISPYAAASDPTPARRPAAAVAHLRYERVPGSPLWEGDQLVLERASMHLGILNWLRSFGCEPPGQRADVLRTITAASQTQTQGDVLPLVASVRLWETLSCGSHMDQARYADAIDPLDGYARGRVNAITTDPWWSRSGGNAAMAVSALQAVYSNATRTLLQAPFQLASSSYSPSTQLQSHRSGSVIIRAGVETKRLGNLQSLLASMLRTGKVDSELLECCIEHCCAMHGFFRCDSSVALTTVQSLLELGEKRLARRVLQYLRTSQGGAVIGSKNISSKFTDKTRRFFQEVFEEENNAPALPPMSISASVQVQESVPVSAGQPRQQQPFYATDLLLALSLFGRSDDSRGMSGYRQHNHSDYSKIIPRLEESALQHLQLQGRGTPDALSLDNYIALLNSYGRVGRRAPHLVAALNDSIHSYYCSQLLSVPSASALGTAPAGAEAEAQAETQTQVPFKSKSKSKRLTSDNVLRFVWANARLNNCPSYLATYTEALLQHYYPVAEEIRGKHSGDSSGKRYVITSQIRVKDFLTLLWAMSVLQLLSAEQYQRVAPILDACNLQGDHIARRNARHLHNSDGNDNSAGTGTGISAGGRVVQPTKGGNLIQTMADQVSLDQLLRSGAFNPHKATSPISGKEYRLKQLGKLTVSKLQADVSRALSGMGISHTNEFMTNIGYSADMFIRPDTNLAHFVYNYSTAGAADGGASSGVVSSHGTGGGTHYDYEKHSGSLGTVVEIDGPSHYETYLRRPLGPTSMKHRHLRQAGYNLVVLPYWEWSTSDSASAKKVKLVQLLRASLEGSEEHVGCVEVE